MERFFLLFCLSCLLFLGGCKGHPPVSAPDSLITEETVETIPNLPEGSVYATNLLDEASRTELDHLLDECGISPDRRQIFWAHVDQFNTCEGITGLRSGYSPFDPTQPEYDVYALQDAWDAAHPEFIGYNCRITAFSLFGDFLTLENTDTPNATALFLDAQALMEDPSALIEEEDLPRFLAFFSVVEGENTTDSAHQAQLVQAEWERRGVHFRTDTPASLISLFVHNQYSPEENELLLGHTGVLLDSGKELIFVEKLAFQAPYQVTKFQNHSELVDYLMRMYDTEWDQPTAKPFILENDQLLA